MATTGCHNHRLCSQRNGSRVNKRQGMGRYTTRGGKSRVPGVGYPPPRRVWAAHGDQVRTRARAAVPEWGGVPAWFICPSNHGDGLQTSASWERGAAVLISAGEVQRPTAPLYPASLCLDPITCDI